TGIRLRTGYFEAFLAFRESPQFTDADMILFLKSTLEQARYLRHHHNLTSNWLTFEMAGLYTAGVLFPQFKQASDWRNFAGATAYHDLKRGWLPDGMTIELSPGYGQ